MQQLLTEANSFKFKFIKFELIVLTLQHHLQLSFELLRLTIERIKPMNAESIISNPPLKLENSFELQIIFEIHLRIFAQPCTWKELTNYTKFERLFNLLWSLKTRYFYTTLDIVCSVPVGECFVCWIKLFRYLCHDFSSGK